MQMRSTQHRQGVAIWGGPNWERVNRFAHSGVCLLEFSPNEKFIITYNSQVRVRTMCECERVCACLVPRARTSQ